MAWRSGGCDVVSGFDVNLIRLIVFGHGSVRESATALMESALCLEVSVV